MKGGGGKRTRPRCVFRRPVQFDLNYDDDQGLIRIGQESMGIDISARGLGVFTVYPLKKDDVLGLRFVLAAVGPTVPVLAKVAWTKQSEKRCRAGLEFIA